MRTRTQALLDNSLLIDFPPDSYCHALRYGLNLGNIHTLLVTHSHMDHWFPTDLIHRHEHFGHGVRGVLDVYGNEAVEKIFCDNIFIDRFKPHPVKDVVRFHVIHGGDQVQAGDWNIIAVPADHDKREESLVYICKKDGKTVFYGHDTGCELSEKAWSVIAAEKYSLVSLDATMGQKTSERYHMGLPDAERMFEKLADLGCMDDNTVKVVNHFSHNGEMSYEQLADWGSRHGILSAYDGMEVEF